MASAVQERRPSPRTSCRPPAALGPHPAALLLARPVPLRTVQQVLRHAKVSLTADLYGHLALDVTRDALEAMDVPT